MKLHIQGTWETRQVRINDQVLTKPVRAPGFCWGDTSDETASLVAALIVYITKQKRHPLPVIHALGETLMKEYFIRIAQADFELTLNLEIRGMGPKPTFKLHLN